LFIFFFLVGLGLIIFFIIVRFFLTFFFSKSNRSIKQFLLHHLLFYIILFSFLFFNFILEKNKKTTKNIFFITEFSFFFFGKKILNLEIYIFENIHYVEWKVFFFSFSFLLRKLYLQKKNFNSLLSHFWLYSLFILFFNKKEEERMLGLSNGLSSSLNTHWTPMQQHLDTGEDETVDLVVNHFTTFWHVPVVK